MGDSVARLGLVDQTELTRWADSLGARSDLPRLIRRLILETGRGVVQLGFPGGEGIAAGSWDGTARATEATAFIPAGLSLWELSVEKSVKKKADKDYAKRLTTPDGSPTGDCTYVAVSLRRFKDRPEWAREKTSLGRWREVRALGIDDIETWLDSAPVTHAWLSELLGFHPHGLQTAETWWPSWSGLTKPPFPAAAVLAGRERESDALRSELAQPGRIITVEGASQDDVLAFVSAVGVIDAQTDGGLLLARTALIDKVEAWRRLRDQRGPLLLVPRTEEVIADCGTGSTHHVIVPVVGTDSADITLPPIDSQKAKEALEAAGLEERQADETGKLARLSLLAARRRIAIKPELHRPKWATTPVPRLIRRVLLAGRWDERSAADVSVISSILGSPYDSLLDELAAFSSEHDPLLVRLGTSVGLVSPIDAWLLLRGQLRKEDLDLFQASVLTVFGESDPALELPPDDRWQASVLDKVRAYSGDLRQGLATTLTLLGSHGDTVVAGSGLTGKDWATWTVRRILEAANKDETCSLWASLRDVLTLLAEAAPSTFLDAVRSGLHGERPLLQRMFTDNKRDNTSFPDSPHSSLLWALETCAWSPEDFGQVVDLLARLAEVDPGGCFANRPAASLGSIFCPWYPQNSVSSKRRLAALDRLRERHESVAWRLMLSMLPDSHDVADDMAAPRFRDWRPKEIYVNEREYWTLVEEVCRRLLEDVGTDSARWISIIDELPKLPTAVLSSALGQIKALSSGDQLDDESRYRVWQSLRSQVSKHREFAQADWALPADEVDQIEVVERLLEPSSSPKRLAWLFAEDMPRIQGIHRTEKEYDSTLSELRVKAASEIATVLRWPDLHIFAITTKMPWYFGKALAQAGMTEHESAIIDLLNSAAAEDLNFATNYVTQRFRSEGWPWVERHLHERRLSPTQSGRLLLATHDFPRAWTIAEGISESIAAVFWREFPTYGLGHDFSHVETVAQRLLDVRRPGSALRLLALYRRKGGGAKRAELMATALEELLLRDPVDPEFRILSNLREVFSYLEQSTLPAERIARLEWAYLPVFGYGSSPPTLCRYLAQDPSFFVEVLSRGYRPRASEILEEGAASNGEVELSEAEQTIVSNAYRLLSNWRALPGKREDGTIDGDLLKQWVNEARKLLREAHRSEPGDNHIGMVLAASPADPDGTWPCVEVRNLLETLQSGEIENGLEVQLHRKRGATRRGMLDGGDQERDLVAKYKEQADQFADRWPRTAAILRRLANSYEREGRYFEGDAERRRTGFES